MLPVSKSIYLFILLLVKVVIAEILNLIIAFSYADTVTELHPSGMDLII